MFGVVDEFMVTVTQSPLPVGAVWSETVT